MSLQIASIVALALVFVLATMTRLNLGALAFVAVFAVGSIGAALTTEEIFKAFPGSTFALLVGVTYLFNIARLNGTVDWIIARSVRLVGGRRLFVPWIMFALAGLLSAIGAIAAVIIVAPIALTFAARARISQTLMSIMVIHGAVAGVLSPISVYGVVVRGILETNQLTASPGGLLVVGFAANLCAATAVFVTMTAATSRRAALARRRVPVSVGAAGAADGDSSGPTGGRMANEAGPDEVASWEAKPLDWQMSLSLLSIVVLAVLAVTVEVDIGLLGFTLAVLLGLFHQEHHKEAVANVPWSVILLVAGILTYIGVLTEIGTIKWVSDGIAGLGTPTVGVLLLAYVGAVVSAFAVSSGVVATVVPLAVPLLLSSDLTPWAVAALLAVAASIVDVSPMSSNGAMAVASATPEARDRVFRSLLVYGAGVVLLAPPVVWLAIIVVPAVFL